MSAHYPKQAEQLEGHFRLKVNRVKTSNHVERFGQTGQLAELQSSKRRAMEGHSYGTNHCLGEDHPATLDVLYQLGETLEHRGRLEEAVDCFRRVLEGRESKIGGSHGAADRSRRELARVLKRLGRHEEAEELMDQVVHPGHLHRTLFEENHVRGGAAPPPPPPEEPWRPLGKIRNFGLQHHAAKLVDNLGLDKMSPRTRRLFVEAPKKAEDLQQRSITAREKLERGRVAIDATRLKYGLPPASKPAAQSRVPTGASASSSQLGLGERRTVSPSLTLDTRPPRRNTTESDTPEPTPSVSVMTGPDQSGRNSSGDRPSQNHLAQNRSTPTLARNVMQMW